MICLLALLGLGGCGKVSAPDTEPIDGGNTTHVDNEAPKEITSKVISALDASFFLSSRWNSREDHVFHFVVEDRDGILVASEEYTGVSATADSGLMSGLQAIIDKYGLVSMNGLYDVTAGLPPEFQPGGLSVEYVSREKLSFTTDNDPYAAWAEEMYDLFARWFSEQGQDALYPEKEDSQVETITVLFREDGILRECRAVTVDGEPVLLKEVYDDEKGESLEETRIPLPDGFLEEITGIIGGTDLLRSYDFSVYDREAGDLGNHEEGYYGMGPLTTAVGEEDSDDRSLEMRLEYESGRRYNIETRKVSEIEGMRPILEEIVACFERYLAQ